MGTTKYPPSPFSVALGQAHDWTEAALFQARRLTELLDYHLSFDRRNAMPAEWRAFKAANVLPGGAHVETLEGYLFLVALHRVTGALPGLAARGAPKEVATAARVAKAALPARTDLKNLLDAPHEGLLVGGKRADFFESRTDVPATPVTPASDYVIGRSVSLPLAVEALAALAKALGPARLAASQPVPAAEVVEPSRSESD